MNARPHAAHYAKHRAYQAAYRRRRAKEDPGYWSRFNDGRREKIKRHNHNHYRTNLAWHKAWWQKHYARHGNEIRMFVQLHRLAFAEHYRRQFRRNVSELRDPYVKCLICRGAGLKRSAVPSPLVELKRAQLQLVREIKQHAAA